VLYQNDDFGKDYVLGLKDVLRLLLTSFGLPGIDLGPPVPQAKEAGTVPSGPGDGKGDLGETVEGLAVPGKTVRHDHDAMGLSVPFADQNSPGGWRKSPLIQPGQVLGNSRSRTLLPRSLLEHLEGLGIEVTKSVGLEPVGDDPKQEIAGEMLRGRLAKGVPPTNPQRLQIEIAQLSDLIFD
jgi:hypothetical protein